jgi:hypothetical protein
MLRFFHPQMIEQSAKKPGPELDQMIDFIIAGLTLGTLDLSSGGTAAGKTTS